MANNCKYKRLIKQVSYDGGVTYQNVTPEVYDIGDLIEEDSQDCKSSEIQYRWKTVTDEYLCVGYNKYEKQIYQYSEDGGTTWKVVLPEQSQAGNLIETNSEDCGYDSPYLSQYFTTISLTDGIYTPGWDIYYSKDSGNTWSLYTYGTSKSINTLAGEIVYWKYTRNRCGTLFNKTPEKFDVEGNIMSLLYGDNFVNSKILSQIKTFKWLFGNNENVINSNNLYLPATSITESCYAGMFQGCTNLKTSPKILPATKLQSDCYAGMFSNCPSLITTPQLPALTAASGCYSDMFRNCTSLSIAPELPATDGIGYNSYLQMFEGCTSLTSAPSILPATTLAEACYQSMFKGCTALTKAPVLPALNLIWKCYETMFQACHSLTYIKAMFTTHPTDDQSGYTYNWVWFDSASGTFVKNSAATWNVTGPNGVPNGWAIEYADS